MKTAMQELKEKLLTTTFLSGGQMMGIRPILDKLLEKEKQQIIDACNYGISRFAEKCYFDYAEQHYTKTYNK